LVAEAALQDGEIGIRHGHELSIILKFLYRWVVHSVEMREKPGGVLGYFLIPKNLVDKIEARFGQGGLSVTLYNSTNLSKFRFPK
jgi:hypothetical protein